MKTFRCHCGNVLNFENSICLSCNRKLGYLPDEKQLSALEPTGKGQWQALVNNQHYRQCKNYTDHDVCNWMVPVNDHHAYCESCRLNHTIPNLSETQNITLWYRIESAKRRLLYTLFNLNLPVIGRAEDPAKGMAFDFLQDEMGRDEFSNELSIKKTIATGHSDGTITINLLEAEHSSREEMREKMNEAYRTLLGHFRHESGHYYWDRLINGTDNITGFRELFGDEQLDYTIALNNYYNQGPPEYWQNVWISAYASVHPWEDWAETWAHYLHMVDTLETAHDFGFQIHGVDIASPNIDGQMASGYQAPASFDELFTDWCRLSTALNALNRSMGLEDAYPFVISITALDKLRYVHQIVKAATN
ncbi:MAG: putative zinc-binding peptidase [Gammaproteobacteria bacterium]|nr:putative zinc-binding peptidase [Gammaproteobacteria bacterium]